MIKVSAKLVYWILYPEYYDESHMNTPYLHCLSYGFDVTYL
jgi:hypothetical protein